MDEKILTLHPQGKAGVNISKAKYDQMRAAILDTLAANGEMTFKELNDAVGAKLDGKFDGSISWYCISVKLDLEARNVLMRVPQTSPQRIHLTNS